MIYRGEGCLMDCAVSTVVGGGQGKKSWKPRERRISQEAGDDQLSQWVMGQDKNGKCHWICEHGNYPLPWQE